MDNILESLFLIKRAAPRTPYFLLNIGLFEFYIYADKDFVFCEPQIESNSLKDYSYVEIVIVPYLECFKNYNWYSYYNKISGLSGKNIPIIIIPQIIRDLERLNNLRSFI